MSAADLEPPIEPVARDVAEYAAGLVPDPQVVDQVREVLGHLRSFTIDPTGAP